jgi:hypothetical protein
MTANRLRIVFDKNDCIFHTDEPISGKVVVEAAGEISCREIRLAYGWRTHGKGNTDKGDQANLSLINQDLKIHPGETREFSFRFDAPSYPLSYHGYYFNIDWYLKATLDILHAPDLSTEEDFLLVGKDPPKDDWPEYPRQVETRPSVPSKSSANFSSNSLILVAGVILATFLLAIRPALGVVFIALLIAFFFRKHIFNLAFKLKMDMKEVQIQPPEIHPGDRAACLISFQTKSSVYLDHIEVFVKAVERTVSGSGSRTSVFSSTLYEKQYDKSYREELAAGRWIIYECPLAVPPNVPANFYSSSNSIRWALVVKIACKGWLSYEKTIPFPVSPR